MEIKFSSKDAMDLAEKKVSIDGWKSFSWEAADGGHIIAGCVPNGNYKSGPRKGRPRFDHPVDGTEKKVIVSEKELKEKAEGFESRTGFCWNCKGSGKVFSGWNHKTGTRYKPCDRCFGSGKVTKITIDTPKTKGE